ncbi:MAG: L-serine ammonia-lyase, iron-sulfur-dependent subunit beta [Butyrivibrio sp.]|nr:L-serine ammonia-lyase, iron-sulfur-dependent subunit beta [Butyrivibrio sp.]
MNLFDIVGPTMVGPSSSHTAGAVRIGNVCRKLLGEPVKYADIYFHGSFWATGKGHGTDKAIVAGLLGMAVDDENIPHSFEIAQQKGLEFSFSEIDLGEVHPNTVKLILKGVNGKELEVVAASVGGGRINVSEIDGQVADFSGEYPTLIIYNQDKPGLVAKVSDMLQNRAINIATMQLHRSGRGGIAVMVIETDQEVWPVALESLRAMDGVDKVTYYSLNDM